MSVDQNQLQTLNAHGNRTKQAADVCQKDATQRALQLTCALKEHADARFKGLIKSYFIHPKDRGSLRVPRFGALWLN